MSNAIGAKARLERENHQLKARLDAAEANVVYLLRYVVDLQQAHGDDFPFPELEARFSEHTWRHVL